MAIDLKKLINIIESGSKYMRWIKQNNLKLLCDFEQYCKLISTLAFTTISKLNFF